MLALGDVAVDGVRKSAEAARPVGVSLLGHLLRSRLDSISMPARLAVKTAAVIGETFTLSLISRVCTALSEDQLAAAKQVTIHMNVV